MSRSNKSNHISSFLNEVKRIHSTGIATELSYRSAIEELFNQVGNGITTINEGKRIECGAPDISFLRDGIAVGYLEGKDLNVDIRHLKGRDKQQLDNYRTALPNLILTNCLDWHYYKNGEKVRSICIGNMQRSITFLPENFEELASILQEFLQQKLQTITEPNDLAQRMAGKARLIKEVFHMALKLEKSDEMELTGQYKAFKRNLIPDISIEDFSETYAETITYGLFAARLSDTNPEDFNRKSALFLIPKTNPFLRSLFSFIAGPTLDDRLAWIIDDLAEIFRVSDMERIMEGFGKFSGRNDPIIHFYETFLSTFNPQKRKEHGVWYTPMPVVRFIVNAVDQLLQSEFDLADGLADTSKVTISYDSGQREQTQKGKFTKDGKHHMIQKEVHRVQILDPCTGTGTFLAEVINAIHPKVKHTASANWSSYVEEDLIPRLHGFELLMASYAMCHMKLNLILDEYDYKPKDPQRLSVYLTNSLEEGAQADQTLLMDQLLVREAKAANTIKRDLPIMCVIGNPPYLSKSGVPTKWIGDLLADYKKEPDSEQKLQDLTHPINDLYIRFIRLTSHFIEKNDGGIMGLITNHAYLDSVTFRGMRWHLLDTFDKIWILDLHGNVMKKEESADGNIDQNVFDIRQGVAVIIAIRNNSKKSKYAELKYGELYGSRQSKYDVLEEAKIDGSLFKTIETRDPYFPFIEWNYEVHDEYMQGFSLDEFMPLNLMGIKTNRDQFTIDEERDALWDRMQRFVQLDPETAKQEFNLGKDGKSWKAVLAQKDVKNNLDLNNIVPITYRPFDVRWTFYTGKPMGIHCTPSDKVMSNFILGENVGLVFSRQVANDEAPPVCVFATNTVFDNRGVYSNRGASQVAPLYIYSPNGDLIEKRRLNFDRNLLEKLNGVVQDSHRNKPDEWAVFDYIYGTLFSKSYQEKFDKFLRMDFPRIPWPKNSEEFWKVSNWGKELRQLHLSLPATKVTSKFKLAGEGSNIVESVKYENSRIWINETQCFAKLSEEVWNLYIGGYQPAQQWLKYRKGKELNYSRLKQYLSILDVLAKTAQLLKSGL